MPSAKDRKAAVLERAKADISRGNKVVESDRGTLEYIATTLLKPFANQPRHYFDDEKMLSLESSVREKGILTPLLLRPVGEEYEVVAGERRWRTAVKLGIATVPARVRQMSDQEAREVALLENLQRDDLNPLEATDAYLEILSVRLGMPRTEVLSLLYRMKNEVREVRHNVMPNPEFQKVHDLFAGSGDMSWYSFLQNRVPLLALPDDILEVLRQGSLEYTKAMLISKVKDATKRQTLLSETLEQDLSVAVLRQRVRQTTALKPQASKSPAFYDQATKIAKRLRKPVFSKDPHKHERLKGLLDDLEQLLFND
jgi:ParB family transcriptional regulator, chromosome partitioning protein